MHSKLGVCTSHSYNYDYLEEGILNIIKEMCNKYLDLDGMSSKITPKCKKENEYDKIEKKLIKLKHDVEKITNNLDKMYIDKLEGKITEEMYNRINDNYLKEKCEKEKDISSLELLLNNISNKIFTNNEVKKIIAEFLTNEKPTREMILKLIDKVEIHKSKEVDIYFNFKELNFLLA